MARKTTKRGRKGTVWIPKTIQLTKRIGKHTVKKVRFLLKDVTHKIKKIPGYIDRVTSRTIHRYTSKHKRH